MFSRPVFQLCLLWSAQVGLCELYLSLIFSTLTNITHYDVCFVWYTWGLLHLWLVVVLTFWDVFATTEAQTTRCYLACVRVVNFAESVQIYGLSWNCVLLLPSLRLKLYFLFWFWEWKVWLCENNFWSQNMKLKLPFSSTRYFEVALLNVIFQVLVGSFIILITWKSIKWSSLKSMVHVFCPFLKKKKVLVTLPSCHKFPEDVAPIRFSQCVFSQVAAEKHLESLTLMNCWSAIELYSWDDGFYFIFLKELDVNTSTSKIFFSAVSALRVNRNRNILWMNLSITRFCGMVKKEKLLCRSWGLLWY